MPFNPILFINYIEESIASLIVYFILGDIKYADKRRLYSKIIICVLIYSVLGYSSEMAINSYALLKIVQMVLEIFLIIYLLHPNISTTLLLYAINFSLVYLIQEPLAFVFHFFVNDISDYGLGLLGNLLTIIILYAVKKYTPIRKYYKLLMSQKTAFKIIIINLFLILQVIDYYYKIKTIIYQMNMMFILISLLIMIILNFLIIYEEQKVYLKEKELNLIKMNSSLMENMITEIRRNQHQYDDRINALISLASVCKDYDSLKNELLKSSNIIINNNADYDVLKLNLKLVAALIFSKMNQAKAANILLAVEIKKYNLSTHVPENDLIDILGIMINNMLEATPANSSCTLTIDSIEDKIIIKTKNEGPKLNAELQKNLFTKGYTTKDDEKENLKNGYGLYNLRKLVLEHKGSFFTMNEYSADRLKTYIVFIVEV